MPDEPIDIWMLKSEKHYADCQARQDTSIKRMRDAMDHLWSRLTRRSKIW